MDTAAPRISRSPDHPPAPLRVGRGQAGGSVTALVRPVEHPLGHLDLLESLAIFIIREVAAESERPVLLFSGGKDSAVLLHLAAKAFKPGKIPFPVLHVDTGHNFAEVLDYRDAQVEAEGARLLVAKVQDSIDQGRVADPGPVASRNRLQTTTLLDAINAHRLRRRLRRGAPRRGQGPGQGARALVPRLLRAVGPQARSDPSCGSSTRAACGPASTCAPSRCRTGPSSTSGSTSAASASSCPPSTTRTSAAVVERDGMLLAVSEWVAPRGRRSRSAEDTVRFRTVGDATCTGAVRSDADTVDDIIREVSASRISERGATRGDDRFSETAMEDRKREGYF